MKIAVLGSTGGVGRLFIDRVLNEGHEVRALARDPSKLLARDGLEIVQGNASNYEDVQNLIAGAERVVSALGNPYRHGDLIMEKGADNILNAAAAEKTSPKCLFVSALGCGGTSKRVKLMLNMLIGHKSFEDYDKADARVCAETRVPWVLVRPPRLSNDAGRNAFHVYREAVPQAKALPRADLALFLRDAMLTDEWDGGHGVQIAGV